MNEKKQAQKYKYFFILSLITLIVSLSFQIYISNATALKGKDFQHLYERKEALEKEIAYLQYEDAQLSSLNYIEQRAGELGFQEMSEPLLPIKLPTLASLSTR